MIKMRNLTFGGEIMHASLDAKSRAALKHKRKTARAPSGSRAVCFLLWLDQLIGNSAVSSFMRFAGTIIGISGRTLVSLATPLEFIR
jgi:hypothetical protein